MDEEVDKIGSVQNKKKWKVIVSRLSLLAASDDESNKHEGPGEIAYQKTDVKHRCHVAVEMALSRVRQRTRRRNQQRKI